MEQVHRAVLLLSSGIDSPVAGHMLMRQGVEVIGLNLVLQDKEENRKVIMELAKKIGLRKVISVPYAHVLDEIRARCQSRFRCVICKRMMYRIACGIAEAQCTRFIASGENLGQVASQTLANIATLHAALDKDIIMLQPLLCLDKNEIITIAREIGTFNLSSAIKKECTYVPNDPATKSRIGLIEKEEARIDVEKLVMGACGMAVTIDLDRYSTQAPKARS